MSKKNRLFRREQARAVQQAQPAPAEASLRAFAVRGEVFQGPIPPPAMLAEYDRLVPGAAARIVGMAETQMAHRQTLEKSVIDGNIQAARRGQYFGFSLGLITILGGFYLIATGVKTEGLTSVITAIAGLVGVFIYGRRKEEKERREKTQALPPQLR